MYRENNHMKVVVSIMNRRREETEKLKENGRNEKSKRRTFNNALN